MTIATAIVDAQSRWERKPADFYPTPPDVTTALILAIKERLPARARVLEPACGDGAMARVLQNAGYSVEASDLRSDSGFGTGGVDFLLGSIVHYDAIVTNPPFKLADSFIRRAVPNAKITAMLLKSQYWHAARRQTLFNNCPPSDIFALTWRPSFLESERGKSPLMDVIWTVWDVDYSGPTRFCQLARPVKSYPDIHYTSEFESLLGGDAIYDMEALFG